LREVFVNIIFNALDAMEPDGGRLSITTGSIGGGAFTRFKDEGKGMAPDVRERIFEPFFTTKGVGGTGLGLSASYAIVERHGGRIEVESQPGHGATFTVWLPLAKPAGTEASLQARRSIKPVNILVVDDDEPVRNALAELLEAHGHTVDRAPNGAEALGMLEANPSAYCVVFADLAMPDMDGLALARAVRSLGPIKTFLITGYGDAALLGKQERGLVQAVLSKPFNEETILKALEEALSNGC
jgi:CheY-like chemotaxis protein